MSRVRIPQPMQVYTRNTEVVEAQGKNIRELFSDLEANYPGIKQALLAGDKLKPDVVIMVDGTIARLGLLQPLSGDNEVVIIPAITGG